MDFLSYIRDQSEKLTNRAYIKHLWDEIEENQQETEISPDAVSDFNDHLPLLLEQFWKTSLEKIKSPETTFQGIDEELKVYLVVLLYQCITQSQDSISHKCLVYGSEVYLHLLTVPETQDLFKSKLYRSVLATLQCTVDGTFEKSLSNNLINKLRVFLNQVKLQTPDLEVTLATLMEVIFERTRQTFSSFDSDLDYDSVAYQALRCLKILLVKEMIPARKFLITTYLFNGLRRHNSLNLTNQIFSIIQTNFRRLLKNLHEKFKDDDYTTFMNAFIHIWKHPDFVFYGEAVLIMNNLREKYYRTLIDVLNKMLMSKNPCRNLFKFALAIICNPPASSGNDKVKVSNEILFRSILMNCLSNKSEISNTAIEALSEVLLSPDFDKDYVKGPIKLMINGENVFNASTVLRVLKSLMNKKWSSRSRNKHLFVICISIILLSEKDYPGLYREVLELLSEEASPYDLKPFLPLISETYLQMCSKNHKSTSLEILKIVFKMALHPMASSTEFVKYLYMAMVYPSVCKGVPIKSEHFIDPILSYDFNFAEFFQKCHTLGLIKKDHVAKLMGDLNSVTESNLKLLCAIAHLTDYGDLSQIAEHINDNFLTICNSPNLTYLLYIYNKILKNTSTNLNQNLRNNEIMVQFLKKHLLKQSFRWDCVSNAFALLKGLEDFTILNEDFRRLKEEYDRKLTESLQTRNNFMPILYYSRLVIFGKVMPSDENIVALTIFLRLCGDERHQRSPEFNPNIWIGLLLLYTNMCIIKNSLIDRGLEFLQSGLNSSITVVKLAALNLIFDLCNMVTHNFEDLIRYMFKQLIYGDDIFKKTCLIKIDRLIRDDYLKLELSQYIIFVSLLGHLNFSLSDHLKRLLSESFFMSNTAIIAKNFVPLIVHINGYKKHPIYKIPDNEYQQVQAVCKDVIDRRKIYGLLLTSLPIKSRFNIVYLLSINILEKMMKGEIRFDEGYWTMIKDTIHIFKLTTSSLTDENSSESYYKKVSEKISKYILCKGEFNEERAHREYQKEVVKGTETLLKLLFFNDSENIQRQIRISAFDAIMHWTDFLMADLVHIVHEDRAKEIQNFYGKVDGFLKKNLQSLVYTEETFESESSLSNMTISSTSTIFNIAQENIPNFDT